MSNETPPTPPPPDSYQQLGEDAAAGKLSPRDIVERLDRLKSHGTNPYTGIRRAHEPERKKKKDKR